jgi:DNA-binding NtrC family response regulator
VKRYAITLAAPDLEAAVHGLVATTDAGDALLAQLEALLSGATSAVPRGPARRSEPFTDAQAAAALRASGENLSAAARSLGCARSTLRDRLDRLSPMEARS